MMNRIRVLVMILVPWIACITAALFNSGCRSIYISSNLGAKLDSIGKAVPEAHDFRYYELDGKCYVECEVHYRSLGISAIGCRLPHLNTDDKYGELPGNMKTPQPARYVLALNRDEIIASENFDYARARCTGRPEGLVHEVPEQYRTHFRPLSADLAEPSVCDNPVDFAPVVRTAGNYARTPLVALVSYGVDVPLTLAGNLGLYTLFGVAALLDVCLMW